MVSIKDNTVSSKNQTINSSDTYFLTCGNNALKVLILGNSMTRHGPCKEIGWGNDWGMAASSIEKDFVHQLFSLLKNDDKNLNFFVKQASTWEREYNDQDVLQKFSDCKEFNPDIIVFRLGENIHDVQDENSEKLFAKKLQEFMSFLRCKNTKIVYTTCFWENSFVDNAIISVAKEDKNGILVNLTLLGKDESNMAFGKFEHRGVAMHPGDKGMLKMAEEIYKGFHLNKLHITNQND